MISITLHTVGSFLVISGLFAAYVAFPALVNWQIDVQYDLANEESEGFRNFVSKLLLPHFFLTCCADPVFQMQIQNAHCMYRVTHHVDSNLPLA